MEENTKSMFEKRMLKKPVGLKWREIKGDRLKNLYG
jgi:hypothetical protein